MAPRVKQGNRVRLVQQEPREESEEAVRQECQEQQVYLVQQVLREALGLLVEVEQVRLAQQEQRVQREVLVQQALQAPQVRLAFKGLQEALER